MLNKHNKSDNDIDDFVRILRTNFKQSKTNDDQSKSPQSNNTRNKY